MVLKTKSFYLCLLFAFLKETRSFHTIPKLNLIRIQSDYKQHLPLVYKFDRVIFKSNSIDEIQHDKFSLDSRRISYLILWLGLIGYAFGLSPGGSPESTIIDNNTIMDMIYSPYVGKYSPIFVSIFNALGLLPLILASLLLPGAKLQRVPAIPFVVLSMFLGFFGIGPYLGLRYIKTDISDANKGRGTSIFEFKPVSVLFLGFGLYLCYYAVFGTFDGDRIGAFLEMFKNQRLAHVSTIDFTILSLAVSKNKIILLLCDY